MLVLFKPSTHTHTHTHTHNSHLYLLITDPCPATCYYTTRTTCTHAYYTHIEREQTKEIALEE